MRLSIWIWTLAFVAGLNAAFSGAAEAAVFPVTRACTAGETWNLDSPIPDEYRAEFKAFLADQKNPSKAFRGFSEAIALRKAAHTATEKGFAEYWISRALYSLKVPHIAYTGFLAVAMKTPDSESMPLHAAAVDCLLRLHLQHPSLPFPLQALGSLKAQLDSSVPENVRRITREMAWDAATAGVQALIAEDRAQPQEIESLLELLKGSGSYAALSQGLWEAKQGRQDKTIAALKRFFTGSIPDSLTRYQDTAHLLLARAEYSLGQFDAAADELKLVSKGSNDLANSLSELAWADLMNDRYPEAIGTAMNLDGGGLRHTFAPEAPMVSAMAMNELCQYPDAVREISIFRKNYESAYRWLSSWMSTDSDHPEKLYPQAVQFIRRKSDLPVRVAGEWVRSPLFIASQDEINTLFDERDFLPKAGPIAARLQRDLAMEILKHARELKPRLKIAKMKLHAGEQLPKEIRDSLALLKEQVIHWHRVQLSAPVWVAFAKRFQGTIAPTQQHLIARINSEIKARNLRMLTQLEEISENIQLIEVEIYNGASQDIIWQNAHPDYKQVAKAMREEHDAKAASQVWDWGRTLASSEENGEIWEDELGSFKANLYDNCSSKDKYLAIRMHRHSAQGRTGS